jgi:hypothetical protein
MFVVPYISNNMIRVASCSAVRAHMHFLVA